MFPEMDQKLKQKPPLIALLLPIIQWMAAAGRETSQYPLSPLPDEEQSQPLSLLPSSLNLEGNNNIAWPWMDGWAALLGCSRALALAQWHYRNRTASAIGRL